MCTSSHVTACCRSPLSFPCRTNVNQRLLTNLIVYDRLGLSPIPASLLSIKPRLHALARVLCSYVKSLLLSFFLFFLFFPHSNVRPAFPSPLQRFQCLWAGIGREGGVRRGAERASPADTNQCGGSWVDVC